jgi:hypothetical protein
MKLQKLIPLSATLTLLAISSNMYAVENGDSLTNVIAELGQPQKTIKSGDYEQLIYERGKIELLEGTVVAADLISPAELARLQQAEAEEIKRSNTTAAAHNLPENIRTGIEAKIKLTHAPNFNAMTGKKRLALLREFGAKHPGVDITAELLKAMNDADREVLANTEPKVDYQKYIELRHRLQAAEDREREDDLLNAEHYLMLRDIAAPPWNYYNPRIYTGYRPPRPLRPTRPSTRPIVRPVVRP